MLNEENAMNKAVQNFVPVRYEKNFEKQLVSFLEKCLPQSGRALDINGRHSYYKDIEGSFKAFWCMFDGDEIIGAVAVSELSDNNCELKSLYLLEKYHGMGYGRLLLEAAVEYASAQGYEAMYLDTFSTSTRAVALYRRAGFEDIPKYNDSERSDVFMRLGLDKRSLSR